MAGLNKYVLFRRLSISGQIIGGLILLFLFSISTAKAECSHEQYYNYQNMGLSEEEIWKLCDMDPGYGTQDQFQTQNKCENDPFGCMLEREGAGINQSSIQKCRAGDWRGCQVIMDGCMVGLNSQSFCAKYNSWASKRWAEIFDRM